MRDESGLNTDKTYQRTLPSGLFCDSSLTCLLSSRLWSVTRLTPACVFHALRLLLGSQRKWICAKVVCCSWSSRCLLNHRISLVWALSNRKLLSSECSSLWTPIEGWLWIAPLPGGKRSTSNRKGIGSETYLLAFQHQDASGCKCNG